ncbi:ABC transporter substrate-binding protein [Magnetococcus sp. PR-3]|uniref:ABC transporter substrate-binding protein n=1 Tax=Magnetococcus sp. PR-3 TaxID=3120355 RepID=UPI002FCE316E
MHKLWKLILSAVCAGQLPRLWGVLAVCYLLTFSPVVWAEPIDINLVKDPAANEVSGAFRPGSHVKLFLPNLPYLAISHAINGALVRPANNDRGWQYDLATSHTSIDDTIWEFTLRKGVHFQDGSPFNADSVLLNMAYFKRKPFTFTKLADILGQIEKVDDYTVRFHLTEPYGVFLHDAVWLQFYTEPYLHKFGWNGKPTCPNLAEPGPYGLGPYILHKGYVEGDRSTPEVVLKVNPNYWGEQKPKVETITIYNGLTIQGARKKVSFTEGQIDLTPVPFADQVETVLSPHAKLAVSPSLNNYAMHFNMLNGHPAMQDRRIRYAINHAIDQEYLLNLSMLGEGVLSPTMVSPNFYRVAGAIHSLKSYFEQHTATHDDSTENLRRLVQSYQREQGMDPSQPLQLTLLAQESFLFLIRDIQYFLKQINIELIGEVVSSEKHVFNQLLSTWKGKNQQPWDLLLWGNYDWYKHPWAAFFVYRPNNPWSTITPSKALLDWTDRLMRTNVESDGYEDMVADFIRYIYERNYMVYLPNPHNVYAVNKELFFNPGRSAYVYLRDLEVTDHHWSVRGSAPYPVERKRPVQINRKNFRELPQ